MSIEKIVKRVESLSDEMISLCQTLVRANTVNRYSGDATWGNEGNGQTVIEPFLRDIGAMIDKFDCPTDIYQRMGILGPKERDFRDRPNLVAELDFGGSGRRVVLQAHTDTVGVEGMTIEPFSGEIRDGKIWGRGSSDCKGGIAATIMALQTLTEFRGQLRGSVVFQSVVEEECNGGGAGSLACCARGLEADFALITDGSGPMIGRGYSGVLTVDIHVTGVSGHAARPDGVSAIEKALVIKQALDRFKRERESTSDKAIVNLGVFRGGTHPALIAGDALMSLNMCYPISDTLKAEEAGMGFGGKQIMAKFEKIIREQEQTDAWLSGHPAEIVWVKDLIPFELEADHPFTQQLAATHQQILGEAPEIYISPAWSDGCYLPRFCNIPTLVYGAGTPGKAHSADEFAEVERIINCSKVLAAYLYRQLSI
jgi:acetylornithine deacetylase